MMLGSQFSCLTGYDKGRFTWTAAQEPVSRHDDAADDNGRQMARGTTTALTGPAVERRAVISATMIAQDLEGLMLYKTRQIDIVLYLECIFDR